MTGVPEPNAELSEGRITSIRAQKKAADRLSVYLNGRFAFGIHRDVLLEFELAQGLELTIEQQVAILERDAYFRARSTAYRFVSYRERTAEEIRRRLRQNDYPDVVIDDVLDYLRGAGLVNDLRFARAFAESRFRSRGYGPKRIRADLRKKGVGPSDIEAAVDAAFADRDEIIDRARDMGATRWQRLHAEPDLLKRKKKVYDYLCRRGFGYDTARRIVDELADGALNDKPG